MFFQVIFLALLALLPMVNPPTTATLLLGLSKGMSREHIRRQINMAALYLFATLCVSFFIGSSILDLFGISIPGLRLAGGLIIAFIGFRMLFPSPNQSAGIEANQNIAFVPLTMPSMCGPGTMALVISGAAQIAELPAEADRVVIYAAMVTAFALMSLISWGVLKLADPVCKILGATGIDAMTRIMGFLLVCMGMQFCINGVKEVAQDPVFHGQVMEQPAAALPSHAGSTAFDHLAVPRQP
ncbi:MarC family NAAT transporter [Aeromonas caviae]|uniref:MarC family NAAT transporter n=1 Tax=Aeromonas caviae TaxID=648 RepID=UPI0021E06F88|nr:MarC family NAAT transporter [Aeromonas caviae]MCU9925378.1 MarC family NAAT transporter [Aeromonas caviae]MCX4048158.1 MarC family NAAT transporter [Aeromonas caviae]MCX4107320.1 MarC family NAAT transporter [Aeromonas caviae]MDX7948953.1 MarC family NAAT transporter [Aeromonas caviae]